MAVARGTWSLEKVVADLRSLAAGGETINRVSLLASGESALVAAAERFCGSFGRAVKLAGITATPARPTWTARQVLAEMRRLHRDGIALNSERLKDDGHGGLVFAARKHFGSWAAALAKANVPRARRGRWHTWSEVREALRAAHAKGMKMSTSAIRARGPAGLLDAAIREAGTWNRALERAGLEVVMVYERWSRDDVIAGIRRLHAAGVPLSSNVVIERGHRKLVNAAGRHFKTWRLACYAAIPDYRPLLTRWTRERVIRRLKQRHAEGQPVRSTDVAKQDPTLTAAARRLGLSWREACRLAGIPAAAIARRVVKRRTRWSEASILAELKRAAGAGKPLLVRSFTGSFVQAAQLRFESWQGAMAAAGLARRYARDHATAMANRLRGSFLRDSQRRRRRPRRRS